MIILPMPQKQSPGALYKKGFLKNFVKLTGKHLRQSRFFDKAAGFNPENVLKGRLWHRCFPVTFVSFLKNLLLKNIFDWMFLPILTMTYRETGS